MIVPVVMRLKLGHQHAQVVVMIVREVLATDHRVGRIAQVIIRDLQVAILAEELQAVHHGQPHHAVIREAAILLHQEAARHDLLYQVAVRLRAVAEAAAEQQDLGVGRK